jgi:hypothetical protein
MRFAQEVIPVSFVGKVRGEYCDFFVYTTANPEYVLFAPLDSYGCEGTLQIPVRVADLRDDWASKLIS